MAISQFRLRGIGPGVRGAVVGPSVRRTVVDPALRGTPAPNGRMDDRGVGPGLVGTAAPNGGMDGKDGDATDEDKVDIEDEDNGDMSA